MTPYLPLIRTEYWSEVMWCTYGMTIVNNGSLTYRKDDGIPSAWGLQYWATHIWAATSFNHNGKLYALGGERRAPYEESVAEFP